MSVNNKASGLTKIGVFYDGHYFFQVSSYYAYQHERKKRISVGGLHEFIKHQVASEMAIDNKLCQIVDAHYFRGRLSAREANASNLLYNERLFDEILMNEGVITHYLPLKNFSGKRQEKGVDVWLALEAYELAFYKRFDVLVLIACDGDYVPLVRKLNTLGSRVMLLSWDFEYTDFQGEKRTTRTSQDLLEEVSYPISMHEVIDNRVRKNEPLINNLFVLQNETKQNRYQLAKSSEEKMISIIHSIKNGYGFIKLPPNNLFFHYSEVMNVDFSELNVGDQVKYKINDHSGDKPTAIEIEKI